MGYPYAAFSQLEAGSGRDNCFQASLACYLIAAGSIDPKLGQHAILDQVSEATRGTPDTPSNDPTTLPQAAAGLAHYGLSTTWTGDYQEALAAPWAICLVDGVAITRADGSKPYPASWFGGETGPDHFVLWGPIFQGAYDWLMNPLDPAGGWAQYDLASVKAAWGGAYLLPAIGGHAVPRRWTALRRFGLLATPRHTPAPALVVVGAGAAGVDYGDRRTDAAGTVWARLGFGDRGRFYAGWAPAGYLREVSSTTPVQFGVDCTSAITADLVHTVAGALAAPAWIGRYLGNWSLTPAEVTAAHAAGLALALVCNVAQTAGDVTGGEDVGTAHAQQAATAARELGAPAGVAIWVDLEAGWTPSVGYLTGYARTIHQNGYVPGAYLNVDEAVHVGPWQAACAAAGVASYVWSSEPEEAAWAGIVKPDWFPFGVPHVVLHQYAEGALGDLVDLDLATDEGMALLWRP